MPPKIDPLVDRRQMLAGTFGLALLPVAACAQPRPPDQSSDLIAGSTCPVTPRQTEGPFYFDPQLVRQDIGEGRPGVPLRLKLQIVAAAACAPLERARVDLWHCDAAGTYSGYDHERSHGETFLRGTQFAGARGVAEFRTLYPGWYPGRAPHIHLKAWTPDGRELTSQLYFPDDLSDALYGQAPYAGRRGRRVRNEDDGIFARAGGRAPVVEMAQTSRGYEGAVVIALG
jgi:protocatechuate 3,4-dioxygenase beta subunit